MKVPSNPQGEEIKRGTKHTVKIYKHKFSENYRLANFYEDLDGLRCAPCKWCFWEMPDWRWDFVKEVKAEDLDIIIDPDRPMIVSKELLEQYTTLPQPNPELLEGGK